MAQNETIGGFSDTELDAIGAYLPDLLRVPGMSPSELTAFRRRVQQDQNSFSRQFVQGLISDVVDGSVTTDDILGVEVLLPRSPGEPSAPPDIEKYKPHLEEAGEMSADELIQKFQIFDRDPSPATRDLLKYLTLGVVDGSVTPEDIDERFPTPVPLPRLRPDSPLPSPRPDVDFRDPVQRAIEELPGPINIDQHRAGLKDIQRMPPEAFRSFVQTFDDEPNPANLNVLRHMAYGIRDGKYRYEDLGDHYPIAVPLPRPRPTRNYFALGDPPAGISNEAIDEAINERENARADLAALSELDERNRKLLTWRYPDLSEGDIGLLVTKKQFAAGAARLKAAEDTLARYNMGVLESSDELLAKAKELYALAPDAVPFQSNAVFETAKGVGRGLGVKLGNMMIHTSASLGNRTMTQDRFIEQIKQVPEMSDEEFWDLRMNVIDALEREPNPDWELLFQIDSLREGAGTVEEIFPDPKPLKDRWGVRRGVEVRDAAQEWLAPAEGWEDSWVSYLSNVVGSEIGRGGPLLGLIVGGFAGSGGQIYDGLKANEAAIDSGGQVLSDDQIRDRARPAGIIGTLPTFVDLLAPDVGSSGRRKWWKPFAEVGREVVFSGIGGATEAKLQEMIYGSEPVESAGDAALESGTGAGIVTGVEEGAKAARDFLSKRRRSGTNSSTPPPGEGGPLTRDEGYRYLQHGGESTEIEPWDLGLDRPAGQPAPNVPPLTVPADPSGGPVFAPGGLGDRSDSRFDDVYPQNAGRGGVRFAPSSGLGGTAPASGSLGLYVPKAEPAGAIRVASASPDDAARLAAAAGFGSTQPQPVSSAWTQSNPLFPDGGGSGAGWSASMASESPASGGRVASTGSGAMHPALNPSTTVQQAPPAPSHSRPTEATAPAPAPGTHPNAPHPHAPASGAATNPFTQAVRNLVDATMQVAEMGSLASGIGSALGSSLGGPIGSALGSSLGGAGGSFGSAFGSSFGGGAGPFGRAPTTGGPMGSPGMTGSVSGSGPYNSSTGSDYVQSQNFQSANFDSTSGGSNYDYFTDPDSGTGGYVDNQGDVHTYDI
ncbi:hypothetical protein [Bauldia sp.]|uniref:hypothetical protein n=1 Tax=Bauldia sp. TaxID=2575872 RepID=UPI003BABADCB